MLSSHQTHLLQRACQDFGLPAPTAALAALGRYLDLLARWNERINLTAVRDPDGMVEKHFVDSLAVVPHVPAEARTLVDVGSGPGFPGAVVALWRPDLRVTLVESLQKKCAFLEAVRREVPVPNVVVVAARAEQFERRPGFEPFDVAVSRATLHLPDWLALGARLVRAGGLVLGMEGADRHPLPERAERIGYRLGKAERAIVKLPVFHVEHR